MPDTQTPPAPVAGEGNLPANAGAGAPPNPTPPSPPAPQTWYAGADELTRGYVQNKGWDDPLKAVSSYQNLEKLLGADRAGRTVVLPKEGATPEELNEFYAKLGRPADPKEYKFDVPDGAPTKYAEGFRAKAHELGLSAAQVAGLAGWNNEFAKQAQESLAAERAAKVNAEDAELKQRWGAAYPQELGKAQAAARGLGVSPEVIDQLAAGMGHAATMELFRAIGNRIGEAEFVSGDGKTPFGAAMTPEQAKAKIAELRADKAWTKAYIEGDAEKKAEMARLHAFAYPEG